MKRLLTDDNQLALAILDMHFVEEPTLDPTSLRGRTEQLKRIEYFVEAYQDTDQDTVLFAAEAFVVIREILRGRRPVKLVYLTDFEGEAK